MFIFKLANNWLRRTVNSLAPLVTWTVANKRFEKCASSNQEVDLRSHVTEYIEAVVTC